MSDKSNSVTQQTEIDFEQEAQKIKQKHKQKISQISTKSIREAEKTARARELENEGWQDNVVREANELSQKAANNGMRLVPEKKIKNNSPFVQIMQQNVIYLMENEYMTTAEWMFLLKISGYIGFRSNCIVFECNSKDPIPMSQTDIAKTLRTTKSRISSTIKTLVEKGIIAKAESGKEDINARMYSLFINPNIMYSGDKDKPNETLKAMFRKVPKGLRNLPVKIV